MCEWLSRGEWYDVRLLCGGRTLGAHRAVLASVSTFLRRLLLSCPIDESPTLIVLPEFDLEAMSTVLYYIYNGEVTIPKQKLEKFLDIIKAMQIFIESQYLTQLRVGEIDCNLKESSSYDEIFVLRAGHDDKPLVTFKKLFQRTCSRSDTRDETDYSYYMHAPARNQNEQFKPCFGNLQTSQGDRQRNYFQHGSFIETYPRNSNVNGAAGVSAMLSGSYRAPTSLLLTNANGCLSSDDAFAPSSENAVDAASPSNFKLGSNDAKVMVSKELYRNLPAANISDVWNRCLPVPMTPTELLQRSDKEKCISHLDLSITGTSATSQNFINEYSISFPRVEKLFKSKLNTRESGQNKVAILNKALDNPWCPRLPNSFRPFRRKSYIANIISDENDNNNNIQQAFKANDERTLEPMNLQDNDNFTRRTIEDKKDINAQVVSADPVARSRYACSDCGKTFSQLRNYKYHMSVHRGTKEFAASCTVCGKCFNDRGYLSSHMKIHKNRKEYKCSQCPKSFNQRVAYNMHVRIHTGVKPHVCGQCGKAFSRKMLLKQHQRTHSGERPYACPHCDKRFADRSNMTLHLRLHTGIKPFKCPMCPKSFTKKHHLKSHVNYHTGAKPYSCPRCRLAFTQSSNMRTHLKRCTAEPPDNKEAPASG